MKLILGNKAYSTWSLRPWLLLRHFGIDFTEERIALDQPDTAARIRRHSPTGRVPVLVDGALVVWDSLAICEYVNERWLDGAGWPADRAHGYSCALAFTARPMGTPPAQPVGTDHLD